MLETKNYTENKPTNRIPSPEEDKMPQVKGHATFLTNLRRQATELERRVGIDNSDAHIENGAMEERKRREVEQIHLQQHRAMVERMYELMETRKDCCNYQRMVSLAKETHVEAIMEERRKEKEEIFKRMTSRDDQSKTKKPGELTSATLVRPPPGKTLTSAKNGFSHVQIDDSDSDDNDYYPQQRYGPSGTILLSATAIKPKTAAYPSRSRRRPKSCHPARSIRQIRQALENEFSSLPKRKRRPMTTLGYSIVDENDQSATETISGGGYGPGRSFNELKDLTHIDHLNNAQIQAKQEQYRQLRNQRMAEEQKLLQNRLDQFYARLEKFKKDSNRNVLKSTMLF